MAVNAGAIIVPGHGTVFVAAANTALPSGDVLSQFNLTGNPPTGWTNIGHTSKQNAVSFSRDGGDKTSLDTWLADAVSVVYASTNWGLNVNSLQLDQVNLDLAFGGQYDADGGYVIPGSTGGASKALIVLATDGTGKLLFYIPNTSVALGDAPSIDTSNFFELPLTASILAADSSVMPASPAGVPGIIKLFKTGTTVAAPNATAAAPSGAAQNATVTITGTGFTGTSSVKFGGVNATDFTVNSAGTRIYATVPAGAAGSAPITITNLIGTSSALAYTRA